MSTVLFSGYAHQSTAVKTQKAVSPKATTVSLQHGPSTDKFTFTSSHPSHTEPLFSGFRRGGQYYHGHPNGENRLCSENYSRNRQCDGSSDVPESEGEDEYDGATAVNTEPTSRLGSILPPQMLAALQTGAGRAAEGAAGVLDRTAEHQVGLLKELVDHSKYQWITTLADTMGLQKPDAQTHSQWASEVLRIARKNTPDMEQEWQTRHEKAWREGRADLLLDNGFLSKIAGRLKERMEHAAMKKINPNAQKQNEKSRAADLRIFQETMFRIPTKGHRDRYNTREAEKAARKAAAQLRSTMPMVQRMASAERNETFRDASNNEYRFSADGTQIVYLSDENRLRVTIPPAPPTSASVAAAADSGSDREEEVRTKSRHHKRRSRTNTTHTRRSTTNQDYDRSRYDGGDDEYYGGHSQR